MDRSKRHSRESYSASRRGFVFHHAVIGMLTMLYFSILSSDAASSEFQMPENTGCACPGSMLIYNCTVVGTGTTIWQGTAFTCPAEGITLRHDRFTGGVAGDCNSGSIAITGQSLGVENNCYASQLVVTVSSALHNKTVECVHNSNDGSNNIGSSRLTILEAPYSPPSGVQVFVVHRTNITFGWSFLVPNCTSVNYGVSSNCGSCRENADTISVTCFNWKIDDSNCTFSVQSVICGISGEPSNPLVVALKAPDVPQVTIFPVYSISDQRLSQVSLSINQANPLNFTTVDDTVFIGSVTNYTVYVNSNLVFSKPSCMDEGCNYFVNDDDFPPTTCMTLSDISVKISASNTVGEGQASAGTLIGCTNQFVKVEYNSDTSTISCIFLNKLDRSEKMCSIKLGQCSQNIPELDSANTTTDNAMLQNVQVSESASDTFCVIARNRSYTTLVEGRTSTDIEEDPGLVRILVPIIVVLLMVLTFVVILVVILLFLLRHHRLSKTRRLEDGNNIEMQGTIFTDEDLQQLIKKSVDLNEGIIEKHSVGRDCSVKEFCTEKGLTYRRGSIFYKFDNDMESISKDKRLIFMSKTSGEYFYPDLDTDRPYKMKLLGERVRKPSLKDYTVYVQSLGSGRRHLAEGTSVLYELRQVLQVDGSYFREKVVDSTCTLDDFRTRNQSFGFSRECCIYIERSGCKETSGAACKDSEKSSQSEGDKHKPGQQAISKEEANLKASNDGEEESKISYYEYQPEMILFNKDTETLFTGHDVNLMVERLNNSDVTRSQVINLNKWRIFERKKYNGSLQLVEGHGILVIDKLKDQQQQLSETVLLRSDQFKTVKSKRFERSELKKFQTMHNLDSTEPNVFIEVAWDNIDEQEHANVLDIVLTDMEMKSFFNCSLSPESKIFLKQHYQKEWRIFFLHKNIGRLPRNTWVLCKLDTIHWRPNSLLPVYSKHKFACEKVTTEQTLRDFCGQRLDFENCVLFTELGSLSPAMDDIDDALLVDKQTGVIFTGPYARQIAKEQPSDYTEKENLKVYLLCKKPDKKAKLKPATSVYYLSLKRKKKAETEMFEVLEVSQDKVRMSKFVEENLKLKESTFDSEKAFYEVCPDEEDLLYYKDVYLLKRKWKTTKYEYPNKGVVSCEYKPFYKIKGAPGIGITPDWGEKMFIRSTSYGSRCLTKGALVLYKKEK